MGSLHSSFWFHLLSQPPAGYSRVPPLLRAVSDIGLFLLKRTSPSSPLSPSAIGELLVIFTVSLQFDISYLVGAGGTRTAWEGADPGATTAAVPTVTGKGLAGCTAPP